MILSVNVSMSWLVRNTCALQAPELFANGNPKYTCTVDFWSLGNTVFECIIGYRPYLHTQPPIKW